MKKFLFLNLLFAIYITVSAQIPTGYYKYADALTGSALKTTLYDVIKGHTQYPYTSSSTDTWDILKQTDKDPANPLNVIMIYSGISIEAAQEWNSGAGWTREHVWSKSHGFPPASGQDPEPGAGTDCHHLRPEKPNVNSAKSDRDFDNCQGLPGAVLANGTTDCWKITDVWDPRDEVKGDVARMMFYMATRYRGENGEPDLALIETIPSSPGYDPFYAKLSTLLLWNEQDPIDAFEINRNEVIYSFQHNRNPYIDHPEWVQRIWGVYQHLAFTSIPASTCITDIPYTFNVLYSNPVGNPISLSLLESPAWLSLNTTTQILSGTPTIANIGINHVKISISDGNETVNLEFDIIVSEPDLSVIITENDFTNCIPTDWTTFDVSGTKNWTCASGYNAANAYASTGVCDDWFISPQINFNIFSNEVLKFKSWTQYSDTNHPRMKLKYSSDYVAGQNPENYTWVEIPGAIIPAQNSATWTESGLVDISSYEDIAGFIAFQYTSSGTTSGTCENWKIDDILLKGIPKDPTNNVSDIESNTFNIYPNPSSDVITIKFQNNNNIHTNVKIVDIFGRTIISSSFAGKESSEINISKLLNGLYFIKLESNDYSGFKKFIKID